MKLKINFSSLKLRTRSKKHSDHETCLVIGTFDYRSFHQKYHLKI